MSEQQTTRTPPRCAATTRSGQHCRNRALPGQPYCRVHSEQAAAAPPPKEDAPAPAAEESVSAEESKEAGAVPAEAGHAEPPPEEHPIEHPTEEPAPLMVVPGALPDSHGAADDVRALAQRVATTANQESTSTGLTGEMAASLLRLVADNLDRMAPPQAQEAVARLNRAQVHMLDYLRPEFWFEVLTVLDYQLTEQVRFVRRRLEGDYATDPYGMDPEMVEMIRPFFHFLYHSWWRVEAEGLEHVPAEGRGMLVANHSGVLPWDGAMIATAVFEQHPVRQGRVVRNLILDWFNSVPFLAPLLTSLGQVGGVPENGQHLLEEDELVCTFPEGARGVGKLFRNRYRLQRFGRGGFVQIALRTGAPLVPVAVVGAEEIYPLLGNVEPLARLFGVPFFPITPAFPWLGPLGAVPLPTRWSITFCPPISTAEYGPEAADDPLTVFMLSEQVRGVLQETIDARLAQRTSIF